MDPDLREVTIDEGSVFVKSPTSEEVAAAINSLIQNPQKIEQMSKAMLKHRDEVRVSKIVDKLEKYITIKS